MKANELSCKDLMIGDWVMINPISYYQVEQIRMEFGELRIYLKGTEVFATENEIMPVPLTPEILEKNGFVPKFSNGWTEYLIYKDIVDGLHEMYIRIAYFNIGEKEHKLECFDCRTGGCQIWIKYVHQLQHTLRLCGIEKEIEL